MEFLGEIEGQEFGSLRLHYGFVLSDDLILKLPQLLLWNIVSVIHGDDHKAAAPGVVVRADSQKKKKALWMCDFLQMSVKRSSDSICVGHAAAHAGAVRVWLTDGYVACSYS